MKKRSLSVFLGALLSVLGLFSFTACTGCDDEAAPHEHVWDNGTVTVEATCTKAGEKLYRCTVEGCGETKKESTGKKDHEWDGGKITTAATCNAPGQKTYTCLNCSETKIESIEKLAHVWDEGKITGYPALKTAGTLTYTCLNGCGETKTQPIDPCDAYTYQFVTDIVTESKWSYGTATVTDDSVEFVRILQTDETEPEVWKSGDIAIAKNRISTVGGSAAIAYSVTENAKLSFAVEFKGEQADTVVTAKLIAGESVVALNEQNAKDWSYSSDAGVSLNKGDAVYLVFANGGQGVAGGELKFSVLPDCIHVWDDGKVTTGATCSTDGVKTFTCTGCGATKTEKVLATGEHDFSGEWVKTDPEGHYHKCKNCDAHDTLLSHVMKDNGVKEEPTADRDGIMNTVCETCGYESTRAIPATSHVQGTSYGYSDDKHWLVCSAHPDCGVKFAEEAHSWGEGVVTTRPTLKGKGEKTFTCVCGKTRTEEIPAGADFAGEFTVDGQTGAWKYGKVDYTFGEHENFTFTALTDKNESGDGWIGDGVEIKAGWINAGAYAGIAYTFGEDAEATVKVKFTGGTDKTNLALRLGVKNSGGELKFAPQFFGSSTKELTAEKEYTFASGDTVYFIFSNEKWQDSEAYPNGALSITIAGKDVCAHEWDSGKVTTEATCTSKGVRTYTCSLCGATKTEEIEMKDHEWDGGKVTTEATCTAKGVKTFTCGVCGETKTEDIEMVDHDFTGALVNTDAEGHYHKCKNCDATDTKVPHEFDYAKVDDSVHSKTCGCGYSVNEEHSWDNGVVTKQPTETETGVKTYTCSVCAGTKTETLPVSTHTHSPSTDWSHDKNSHWHACSGCSEKIDEANHTWNLGEVTTEATCTSKGVKTFTCTVCGETKTEDIEMVDHDFTGALINTDADGHYHKCANCDATDTKVSHEFSYEKVDGSVHSKTCDCGYTANENHSWDDGEITTMPTINAEGVKTYTCSLCDGEKSEALPASADFARDFSLNEDTGVWSYGKVDYNFDNNTFNFTKLTGKNDGGDGWTGDGVEVKAGWINAGSMLGISYASDGAVKVRASLNFVGGTEQTNISLRIGIKDSSGNLRSSPEFFRDENSKVLTVDKIYSLEAGDTIYFIIGNENGNVPEAYPNGKLSIELKKCVADFTSDFSLENQDGNWSYGKVDYTFGTLESFTFTAFTEKTADAWVDKDGETVTKEIKAGWINGGWVTVAYTATENTDALVKLAFTGGKTETRCALRIGVKHSDGTITGNPRFFGSGDSNQISVNEIFNLQAGDTLYFMFDFTAGDHNGDLSILIG